MLTQYNVPLAKPKQSYHQYHDEKLESIARNILANYDPELVKQPMPTPIEDIMESAFGLTVEYHPLRKPGQVLGETIFEDSLVPIYPDGTPDGYKLIFVTAGTILIDNRLLQEKYEGRLRFTYAHELAHWVIDRQYFMNQSSNLEPLDKPVSNGAVSAIVERQADRLASRLLMPKCTVKKAFYQRHGQGQDIVLDLSQLYQVSKQAMKIRLEQLGLLRSV